MRLSDVSGLSTVAGNIFMFSLFFLDPLSAGYKSLWRSSNEKEIAESRNRGGRGSDNGDPSCGHTHPFTPSIFCCMSKCSLLASFLVSERWSHESLSTDTNTMHGSVQNSRAGELMELRRFLLQRLFLLASKGEDEMGTEGSGIKGWKAGVRRKFSSFTDVKI